MRAQNQNFRIVDFSPYLDFWTCGNCSQAHFKISILTFWKVNIFEKCRTCRLEIYFVCRFHGLPALCVCVAAACGALATSEKSTPLIFWSMHLADFVIFNDFRAPKALCGCVAAACGASASSKKTRPWILGLPLPLEVACRLPQALPLAAYR